MRDNNHKVKTSFWSKLFYPFKWYGQLYKGAWYLKILTPIMTLLVLAFLFLGAVDCNLFGLFGRSPSMDVIENPVNDEASLIYSADSVVLGKFFSENRSAVEFNEVSPHVINALISTEDERFYSHHGIDFQGLLSAFNDMLHGNARGASTITQQLVKNMFKMRSQYSTGLLGRTPGLKMLIMKAKEWINAVKIENRFSKEEILTLYLNTVDFGSNAFGIKTAAKTYFNTTPANLAPEQAATLVGLLKATTAYNPKVHPQKSKERRNVVLANMLSHEMINKAEYDSLIEIPIDLKYNVENSYDGEALYFRQYLREYLSDWCRDNHVDLFADGLKIYTTLDSRMQKYAEDAVLRQMEDLQKKFNAHWRGMNPWRDERGREMPGFIENLAKKSEYYKILEKKYGDNKDSIDYYMNLPHKIQLFSYDVPEHKIEAEISTIDSIKYMVSIMHCSLVAMEAPTSFVKAWVGDVDFDSWKYDKVTAKRQPGSTFKLFVYAAAFEYGGYTPVDREQDSPITMMVDDLDNPGQKLRWSPHNAMGYCTYSIVTYKTAFAQSINTVAVKVGNKVGIENVAKMAHEMGIHSKLEVTPALSLGASDVSLLELVDGYCTVMNDGMQRDPVLVTKIVDRDGYVIYDYEEEVAKAKRAMSYKSAFYMQQLLWSGMRTPGGTVQALWGYPINNFQTEFGGKTGTSSNHSDAWFVGTTPTLVAGSWVGGEYRCIHFRTGQLGQGSRTALPVYAYFMEKVLADPAFNKYRGRFPKAKEDIPRNTYQGGYSPVRRVRRHRSHYGGGGSHTSTSSEASSSGATE